MPGGFRAAQRLFVWVPSIFHIGGHDIVESHVHSERRCQVGASVAMEGYILHSDGTVAPYPAPAELQMSEAERVRRHLLSDDPRLWRPL